MTQVFIGLGSNLGDRENNISIALNALSKNPHIKIVRVSSLIETDPVGGPPQPKYINGVAELKTDLEPFQLLEIMQEIEKGLGRRRTVKNGPRTLDLDILLFGDLKLDTVRLTIPHPRMWQRDFVLIPLREIEPEAIRRFKPRP